MRIRFLAVTSALALAWSGNAVAQQPFYGQQLGPYGQPVAYAQDPLPMQPAPMPAGEMEGYAPASAGDCGCGTCGDVCGCEDCCDDCDHCRFQLPCPPPGWFGGVEYNMWWTKTRTLPPLVTTDIPTAPVPGALPGATLLFGGDRFGEDLGHGGRLTVGKWLDPYETLGFGVKFLAFRADDAEFGAASDGTTILGVPFFDPLFGIEDAYLVGNTPDGVNALSSGNVTIQDRIDMIGTEVYLQSLLYDEPGVRFDLVGGYHFLRLDNSLEVDTFLTSLDPGFLTPVGSTIDTRDVFETRNEFHGGTLGFSTTAVFERWTFSALGKLSVGSMRQQVIIDGTTVVNTGTLDVRDEGLFALGTNQGIYERDRVSYIPEAQLKLAYAVRPNVNVSLGYTFLYLSNVMLAGDQVDRQLNLSQTNNGILIGAARPEFLGFRETDFWAQGLNFGLDVRF